MKFQFAQGLTLPRTSGVEEEFARRSNSVGAWYHEYAPPTVTLKMQTNEASQLSLTMLGESVIQQQDDSQCSLPPIMLALEPGQITTRNKVMLRFPLEPAIPLGQNDDQEVERFGLTDICKRLCQSFVGKVSKFV